MSSIQQLPASVIAALNDEQKATMEKMMKEIQCADGVISQTNAYGTLRYFGLIHPEDAKFYESHDWSGAVKGKYPPSLQHRAEPSQFEHKGDNNSSKGVVAYYHGDLYWLVAWHVPNNKIYVKSGPKGPIDWNAIEKELDASGATSVFLHPTEGYTVAMATIRDATLSAAFYEY